MGPTTHVTLATATGLLRWALLAHAGAGLVGLVTGFIALFAAKGGQLHRRSGTVFVFAMIAMGVMATGLAVYERKLSTVLGGPFTAYLVFTALTAVKPVDGESRNTPLGLMVLVFAVGLANILLAIFALGRPNMALDGVPAPMIFFMASVALIAGVGDWRMIRAGGVRGTKRIARHLWRMSFALFVASGSFFLGQMRFFPKALRIPMLLAVPALAPLLLLIYWMWRVRVRRLLPSSERMTYARSAFERAPIR
jgi:uncharacterized membrane protein